MDDLSDISREKNTDHYLTCQNLNNYTLKSDLYRRHQAVRKRVKDGKFHKTYHGKITVKSVPPIIQSELYTTIGPSLSTTNDFCTSNVVYQELQIFDEDSTTNPKKRFKQIMQKGKTWFTRIFKNDEPNTKENFGDRLPLSDITTDIVFMKDQRSKSKCTHSRIIVVKKNIANKENEEPSREKPDINQMKRMNLFEVVERMKRSSIQQ
ncbi:hypothetical protein ROZALSC1DRAFT_26491 [Rozella allomycis CSF55]|uniref:Uncharacterized protein n=1 Tax=Rozella allomycis (strain CSF55) TaxID=988480 RepID=A0A075B486_ROZAC|nr:hypothetical protein O9G_003891 [Rozella allomycis CSF55]RKP22108.1 hypothetical protein ROZALSC1DRAFT_26491 [Rozella allomycis CSF55]|eukprot:EPZ35976.1 hypothetical protein O9G_003891 [Rozella allomycis CSF55]